MLDLSDLPLWAEIAIQVFAVAGGAAWTKPFVSKKVFNALKGAGAIAEVLLNVAGGNFGHAKNKEEEDPTSYTEATGTKKKNKARIGGGRHKRPGRW